MPSGKKSVSVRVNEELLRRVIREELVIQNDDLAPEVGKVYGEEHLTGLLAFAKAYVLLTPFVREQLELVLDTSEDTYKTSVKRDAVLVLDKSLGGMCKEIDASINRYHEWFKTQSETRWKRKTLKKGGGE